MSDDKARKGIRGPYSIALRHNFKDLRGGQSDTGDEHTLVIWAANGMDLSEKDHDFKQYQSLCRTNSHILNGMS